MRRADDMAARLPPIYRDGDTVRGLLAVIALQLAIFDEDALSVQQAHWFDAAWADDDIAKLAALLDLEPEPWQSGPLFRGWVHAFRRSLLREGGLTPQAVRGFVGRYTRAFQQATGAELVHELDRWADVPAVDRLAVVEHPRVRRHATLAMPGAAGVEPLQQTAVESLAHGDSAAAFLFVGLPGADEITPVVVNVTTGQALVFLDAIPTGKRLWLVPRDGEMRARLEDRDVTDRLRSVEGVEPGRAWTADEATQPPTPIMLPPGRNELWYLPLGHHDAPGLDRALFALPDLDFTQGRMGTSRFDAAIFHHPPAAALTMAWIEEQPATFHVVLPGWVAKHRPDRLEATLTLRDNLAASLDRSVARLRAAGVESRVRFQVLRERQPGFDRLRILDTVPLKEVGATGADRGPIPGGSYDVTDFDDSEWR